MYKNSHGGILGEPGGHSVDSRGTKMSWQVDLMPYSLYVKLENKLLDGFWEINLLSEKVTDVDNSALENKVYI